MSGPASTSPVASYSPSALSLERRALQGWAATQPAITDAAEADVHRAFRESVPLEVRRAFGTFFTSASLAQSLVAQAQHGTRRWFDPTCGAGDLLLAVADTLPLGANLSDTLAHWSGVLAGSDLHEPLVRTAKARLVLRARQRGGFAQSLSRESYRRMFPSLVVADGLASTQPLAAGTTVLLNPPYGKVVVPDWVDWSEGTTNVAGLFAARLLRRLPEGSQMLAILPEVLRIGSNYRRWRQLIDEASASLTTRAYGAFDDHVLIDVFTLHAVRGTGQQRVWSVPQAGKPTKAPFTVAVGSVVPHRHRRVGPVRRYLDAKSFTSFRVIRRVPERRRFTGRVFAPPFVVVKRTSSPSDRQRTRASVVTGQGPVAIENHLIVCKPTSGSLRACMRLMRHLATDRVRQWLNHHHRCRHLTVGAVRSISASMS